MKKVGFIGLGVMGMPMTINLVRNGYQVFGFDQNIRVAEEASRQGVIMCASVEELAKATNLVLLCLPSENAVWETVMGDCGLCKAWGTKKAKIIDHSTTRPEFSIDLSNKVKEMHQGILFFDAPLSGGGKGAAEKTLTVMVGASEDEVIEEKEVFNAYGRNIFYLGSRGRGQAVKLCQNLIFMCTFSGVMESLVLGESMGIAHKELLEVMSTCIAPNNVLAFMSPAVLSENFKNDSNMIKLISKDIGFVKGLAEKTGANIPVGKKVQELIENAVKNGYGGYDLFYWHKLLQQRVVGDPELFCSE